MKHYLNLVLGAMAMLAVAMVFAFTTIRLAIHGTQVEVPNLAGLTVDEAQKKLAGFGLNIVVVSRFYSTTTPAGHILSQVPAPGVIVRKEWVVRAIESIGPQRVSIPDVRNMPERPAAITIRRLSLDLGTVAHLPAPGDTEIVLAQTPPPNAGGVDSPRVSLLLSQKADLNPAFVMPSLLGLTPAAATARAAALGLTVTEAPAASNATTRTIINQQPMSGARVEQGDTVRLTLGG
jgi:beta-lactam-binding protein with PASTA domain